MRKFVYPAFLSVEFDGSTIHPSFPSEFAITNSGGRPVASSTIHPRPQSQKPHAPCIFTNNKQTMGANAWGMCVLETAGRGCIVDNATGLPPEFVMANSDGKDGSIVEPSRTSTDNAG